MRNGRNERTRVLHFFAVLEKYVNEPPEEYIAVWNALQNALQLTDDDIVWYLDEQWSKH